MDAYNNDQEYQDLLNNVKNDLTTALAVDGNPAQKIIKKYGLVEPGNQVQEFGNPEQTDKNGNYLLPKGTRFFGITLPADSKLTFYSKREIPTILNTQKGGVGIMIKNAENNKPILAYRQYGLPGTGTFSDTNSNRDPFLVTITSYDKNGRKSGSSIRLYDINKGTYTKGSRVLTRNEKKVDGKNQVELLDQNHEHLPAYENFLNNATWETKEPTQRQINFLRWFGDITPKEEIMQKSRGEVSEMIGDYQNTYPILQREFTIADKIAFSQYSHKDEHGLPDKFPELKTYRDALDLVTQRRETGDYRKSQTDPEYNIAGITEKELTAVLNIVSSDPAKDLNDIKSGARNLTPEPPENGEYLPQYQTALNNINKAQEQPLDFATEPWTKVRDSLLNKIEPIMDAKGYPRPKTGELARAYKKQQKTLINNQVKQAKQEQDKEQSQARQKSTERS